MSHSPFTATHIPVLLDAVLELLSPRPGEFMIDGTLDGGGHARALLERIAPGGTLLGIDLDPEMTERFRHAYRGTKSSCTVMHGNYADLARILTEGHMRKADGLLLDLGFSSSQIESSGRGFSFLRDEPLMMTYDPARTPVRELLRTLSETDLTVILRELGGERLAGRVAKAVRVAEHANPIRTSKELADVVRAALPKNYERGRIDPATRTFQALRIYANDELGNLERLLGDVPKIMNRGGRVAIVSFHSLEDGLVKRYFHAGVRAGTYVDLTKKPVIASANEIQKNPRSRSAKLRAIRIATSQ